MLAALGGVSSAYHLRKMLEWRGYKQSRVLEAEQLLREYQHRHPAEAAAMAVGPREPARRGEGGRGGPHKPAMGQAQHQGGAPHLDRRSPVPPGGF